MANITKNTNPRSSAELIKRLRVLGCEVETTRRHLKVRFDGRVVGTLASTPSDGRAVLNTVADLRRRGVDVRSMTVTREVVMAGV